MTRPTSVALGLSVAAAAFSLTFVESAGVASAAPRPQAVAPPTAGIATLATLRDSAIPPNWATPARTKYHPTKLVAHSKYKKKRYTVRPGESFWSIAHAKHVSWYNLAADNHMQLYASLPAGRVLTLPAPGEAVHAAMPLQASGSVAAVVSTSSAPVFSVAPATAAPVYVAPAPVSTSSMSAFEQCVISRESGGNPQVMNASGHWGLFQFSFSTWVAYGGSPSAFGNGSAAVQEQVFANAMARGGQNNWAPYDGC